MENTQQGQQLFIDDAALLLRTFSVQQYGYAKLGGLTGEQWRNALNNLAGKDYLGPETMRAFNERYRAGRSVAISDASAVYNELCNWLQNAPPAPRNGVADYSSRVPHA